jgi:hypothetical protein
MPLLSTRGAGSAKGFGFTADKKPPEFDYLVVAGGGGGGGNNEPSEFAGTGGGGAGG